MIRRGSHVFHSVGHPAVHDMQGGKLHRIKVQFEDAADPAGVLQPFPDRRFELGRGDVFCCLHGL